MTLLHTIDKQFLIKTWWVLLAFIWVQILVAQLVWEEQIQMRIQQAWVRAPLALITYKTFSVIIAPLSGSVMYLLAWWLFGVREWLMYAAIWNFFGMSFAYRIGKKYWKKATWWFVGKESTKEIDHLLSHLTNKKTFVITRCVLLPLEDLINFASGMARVPYWWFISISMTIVTVLSLIVVFFWSVIM